MDLIARIIPFHDQVVFSALAAALWTLVAWGGLTRRTSRTATGCGCRLQRLRLFSLATAVVSQVLALSLWWGTGVLFLPSVGASVALTLLYLASECRDRTVGDVRIHELRVCGRTLGTVPTLGSPPVAGSN